jgi:hypothetical protein
MQYILRRLEHQDGTITGKDVKNRSLSTTKLSATALSSLAGRAGPAGPQGLKGDPGPKGIPGRRAILVSAATRR